MTDNDRLLSRKARQLRPSSLDAATLERVPSSFDEKAVGDRRADRAPDRARPSEELRPQMATIELRGARQLPQIGPVRLNQPFEVAEARARPGGEQSRRGACVSRGGGSSYIDSQLRIVS
jgi:hypothetical protein